MSRVIRLGAKAVKKFKIKGEDVKTFGDIVGDHNPIHSDPKAAKAAGFPAPICYGMLTGSFFSCVMANDLPGPNTVYLSQNLKFLAPVMVGEEVEVSVEVTQFRKDKGLIAMSTTLVKPNPKGGDPIKCIDGTAVGMNKFVEFEGESTWTPVK